MSKNKEIKLLSIGNENETVSMAQQGNMQAFEHLVTLYEGYVYNLCYNVFYNTLDAQDCTQEIFVKIYKNINSFKFNYFEKEYKIEENVVVKIRHQFGRERQVDVEHTVITLPAGHNTVVV